MGYIQNDLSVQALITCIEASLFELIKLRSLWTKAEIADTHELLSCLTNLPYPHFNVVVRAYLPFNGIKPAIQSALVNCRSRKVPLGWVVGPSTRPINLADDLRKHGFDHIANNAGMAVNLREVAYPTQKIRGFTIKTIEGKDDLLSWCKVVYTLSGGMPDFVTESFADLYSHIGSGTRDSAIYYYLGMLDGEPVGASMLLLSVGVAGIYNVATIPTAQRKGFGSAMTAAALQDANKQGYRIGILHSSEMGYPVYKRLGFQEYCKLGLYVWLG